ncbi:hypothetical protein [Marinobacter lutaoensis]|uniref:hypothetical protein n=1 Tax=Marinobacter lutaoensis TaxID=135739 RepID=UPI001FEC9661|nr:hypothetical protein [Marinobacter lutaoensis]
MRIKSKADFEKLTEKSKTLAGGSCMAGWAARQIKQALDDLEVRKTSATRKPSGKPVIGESPGEQSIRLVLTQAFGLWEKGGEVVPELIPFKERRFRCDFALPRWRIYVEVDGWGGHGQFLEDHHRDRERGLFFSAHDWLPFRVSHDQSINSPGSLVDSITSAMERRLPAPRESIDIEPVTHKHGLWYRLNYVE